ncbi:MAG: hypothetical protein J6J97_00100 [Akkermansia sp.]|nr:hypothetical protein [Akkermansia sp.]MBQ8376080.1 hypothetical protein [Akkermansia sp.]
MKGVSIALAWQLLPPGDEYIKGGNPEPLYLFRTIFQQPERKMEIKYPVPLDVSSFIWLVLSD